MSGGAQPYRKGAAFERVVARQLRMLGCLVVRNAGSKGDPDAAAFDLVSIISGHPSLVECKLNGRLDPGPKKRLIDAARHCGAVAVLAKPSKKNKGEIDFVQLWPL
jgi:Holliday junction resolvase